MNRQNRAQLLDGLDIENLRGVEIGPLINPTVRKDESEVYYVDRATTEQLKVWYARDEKLNVDDIVDVDFVWGEQTLKEATGEHNPFDYCVASHVLEHIPDLITWLKEIASILKPKGIACFAVPDRRFTFDYLRSCTELPELLENYFRKLRKPSTRHIFDHFSNQVELNIGEVWSGEFSDHRLVPIYPESMAFSACINAIEEDSYVDSHCSVFTQYSFGEILKSLANLGLMDFKIRNLFGVIEGRLEFIVQLEKLDDSLSPEQKREEFFSAYHQKIMELKLVLQSSRACNSKVYWARKGEGFSESRTACDLYAKPNQTVELNFLVPNIDDIVLRFDPCNHAGNLFIRDIKVVKDGITENIDLRCIKPIQDIKSCVPTGDVLHVVTVDDAIDPSLSIQM